MSCHTKWGFFTMSSCRARAKGFQPHDSPSGSVWGILDSSGGVRLLCGEESRVGTIQYERKAFQASLQKDGWTHRRSSHVRCSSRKIDEGKSMERVVKCVGVRVQASWIRMQWQVPEIYLSRRSGFGIDSVLEGETYGVTGTSKETICVLSTERMTK